MRYATWQLFWEPNAEYGSGPESVIVNRGGRAEGVFFTGDVDAAIVGYVHGDVPLTDLDNWNVAEITSAEALTLAQQQDPEASLDAEGRIVFPIPDPVV